MLSEPVCRAELTQRSGIHWLAGSTSGLAPRGAAWPCPGQVCSEGCSPRSGTHLHHAGEQPAAPLSPTSAPAPLGAEMELGWEGWEPQHELAHHGGCLGVRPERCSRSLPKAGVGNHPGYSISVHIPAHTPRPREADGPSRTPRNERSAVPGAQGLNESQTGAVRAAGPCGARLVSRRWSRRSCQPLAPLEASGWGSALGFVLLRSGAV